MGSVARVNGNLLFTPPPAGTASSHLGMNLARLTPPAAPRRSRGNLQMAPLFGKPAHVASGGGCSHSWASWSPSPSSESPAWGADGQTDIGRGVWVSNEGEVLPSAPGWGEASGGGCPSWAPRGCQRRWPCHIWPPEPRVCAEAMGPLQRLSPAPARCSGVPSPHCQHEDARWLDFQLHDIAGRQEGPEGSRGGTGCAFPEDTEETPGVCSF